MPNVTYGSQSFALDNRPFWVLGASMQYARVPADLWSERLAAIRQAGFNTVETACPWMIHEPRPGRFLFEGDADVRRFVLLAHEADLRVALRLGPYVGEQFDGGGLPHWLKTIPNLRLREANEPFFERAAAFLRRLAGELVELQATDDGPIILVQTEHAWTCSNDRQAETYLRELARLVRECGFKVPVTNANDLWQDAVGTIHTWRGWDDMLVHLRQLRTVQPEAPRLVSGFNPAEIDIWGTAPSGGKSPTLVLRHLAEILAAGGQPVVSPFHAGTNLGFLGGRLAGRPDGFVTTTVAADAPLGEAGARGRTYHLIRRLITFARHFAHVFAELDAAYHPIVLDVTATEGAGRGVSVVPLRGAQGRAVFVFADERTRETTLLLDDGLRLPVPLGRQGCAWTVFDADLNGAGRLDYVNICPLAMIDRSILVLHGPERAPVYLSIDQAPLSATVPAGSKPLVVEHRGLTIVICNERQIDETYENGKEVFVGIDGFDLDGTPRPAHGSRRAWVIAPGGQVQSRTFGSAATGGGRNSRSITPSGWQNVSARSYADATSPRFASLDGPETLGACGAQTGYGWYHVRMKSGSARKRLCHIPQGGHRLHLYLDGTLVEVFGVGPNANPGPLELRLPKGTVDLTVLADNFGRFSEGNDLPQPTGLHGHVYEVKPLRAIKPKAGPGDAVDPFSLRGFISGRTEGRLSETHQLVWTFTHARRSPILVDVQGAAASGTFVLNGTPMEYYAGTTGACLARILLEPASDLFKRGRNELRFAPDPHQERAVEELARATTLYECVENLTHRADWAFGKWEPPPAEDFAAISKTAARAGRGAPAWWRGRFTLPDDPRPAWFDTTGLSKGQLYVNGRNVGRYFTANPDGRAVGPQKRLFLPGPWLRADGPNELLLFDEHGFDPLRTKVVLSHAGERE